MALLEEARRQGASQTCGWRRFERQTKGEVSDQPSSNGRFSSSSTLLFQYIWHRFVFNFLFCCSFFFNPVIKPAVCFFYCFKFIHTQTIWFCMASNTNQDPNRRLPFSFNNCFFVPLFSFVPSFHPIINILLFYYCFECIPPVLIDPDAPVSCFEGFSKRTKICYYWGLITCNLMFMLQ